MKRKLIRLSREYQTALRKHLKPGRDSRLASAQALGCRAAALGLETLDVARIHEAALATVKSSCRRDAIIKRSKIFFGEAIAPIEKTHRAALKANLRLSQLNKTLRQRAADLAVSHRHLKQGMVQRKAVEIALKKSREHDKKLLGESHHLQEHLRHLTHQMLAAQEDERGKISRELHDEIAQTLLGINVRLLTLKKEATLNSDGLKKEIASTQRLVEESVKIISGFARELGLPHET